MFWHGVGALLRSKKHTTHCSHWCLLPSSGLATEPTSRRDDFSVRLVTYSPPVKWKLNRGADYQKAFNPPRPSLSATHMFLPHPKKLSQQPNLAPRAPSARRLPASSNQGRKMTEVRGIQQALIDWVRATAPTVPAKRSGGHHFQLTHLVRNSEQLRKDRIREAVERKFPKLAAWKRDENARTILVLEDNDIQLTNPVIVTETYLP